MIDFSACCIHARRIMVDWEDKGLVYLMDMDHVECHCKSEPEIIDIRNCCGCPTPAIADEDDITDAEIEQWIKWSILGRFNVGSNTKGDTTEQDSVENSEE